MNHKLREYSNSQEPTPDNFLQGTFLKTGNSLVSEGCRLAIKERKNPSSKPLYYLITIPYRYISSLYPTTIEGQYIFDYQGKSYHLELGNTTASIKLNLT